MGITPEHDSDSGQMRISVNGNAHSWLPYGDVHTQLGAVAAIVHPAPREIAVIGLGSGDTAWALGCRAETQSIEVFEICAPIVRLLRHVENEPFAGNLPDLLNDPRLRLHIADGRHGLSSVDRRFDIIQADALLPESANSGNLYSVEFFQLCAARLKPGGLMCQWTATPRTVASFTRAFPYVLAFRQAPVVIGSNEPLSVELETWQDRIQSSSVSSYLGSSIAEEVESNLASCVSVPGLLLSAKPNHDLFPRDEFHTPESR